MYHPYWGISKWHDVFIADVQRAIDTHLMPGESLFFTGDVNDLRHYYSDVLKANCLIQIVNIPTRGKNIFDVGCVPARYLKNYRPCYFF